MHHHLMIFAGGIRHLLTEHAVLEYLLRALRLLSVLLGSAIVVFWAPSLGRVLRGTDCGRDDVRAISLVVGFAVLIFNAIGLTHSLSDLTALRLHVFAHAVMVAALLLAIYRHAWGNARFRLGRAMATHLGLLLLCFAFVSVAQ